MSRRCQRPGLESEPTKRDIKHGLEYEHDIHEQHRYTVCVVRMYACIEHKFVCCITYMIMIDYVTYMYI